MLCPGGRTQHAALDGIPDGLRTALLYRQIRLFAADGACYGSRIFFFNISSKKYLDVSGLPNADNTNVIRYTGKGTASRQFRLQFTYYVFLLRMPMI